MMRKTLMLLFAAAVAVTVATSVPVEAQQQALTPFQRQGLRAVKKFLTETIEKYHRNLDALNDPAAAAAVSEMDRLDVLDEVLRDWTDTPEYGRYAVNVMEWQNHLVITIADMSYEYKRKHGQLDEGFEKEMRDWIGTCDPVLNPPAEYLNRHLCGVLDCRSLK
jgi:hypothetical protein